ncbi:hypothetical protein BST81_17575 [Leptolyngbya sp. 'hensonii']|uniref:hypothetical protein n=1 Tax=Leptolyngbya sp. 'hensonii' TaxID=1922337 RepID=UPI00095001BB|nr:hypothetical protein [Leptolyngbya sp. 'hensonii']OLP17160.1 hypothetical protein BST81_17575 [Leptolyngbya sp. 'hensonii']
MQPPQEPPFSPHSSPESSLTSAPEDREFEQALEEVEILLADLKTRYAQVQQDRQEQADLRQSLHRTEQELKANRRVGLRSELKQIKARLEELELALESRLFSWHSVQEGFWQMVRFGGLGVILGWILKSCAT